MKILFLCLFSLSTLASALSWEDAVAEASKNHPALKAAAADLRAASADKGSRRAAFLPKLDASADINRSGSRLMGDNWGWPAGEGDAEGRSYGGGLRASWRFFDGFASLNQLQESGYNYEARQATLSQEEVDALRQLRVAFIRSLFSQGQLAVAEDIFKRLSMASRYQKLKYDAGRQARWTWTKAEADALDAKWRLEQARLDLDLANHELSVALGRDKADGLSAEGALETKEPLPLDLSRLDDLPVLRRLQSQLMAAEARVDTARAAHWPSLSGNAGWNYSGNQTWPPLTRSWSFGLSAGLNLFNGGSTYFALSAAKENLDSLRQQFLESNQSLRLTLLRAHARAANAYRRVAVADAQLAAARERYDTVAKLGEAGRAGYLDLESAESGLAGAQQQGLALRQEAALASADLDAALGLGIRSYQKGNP